MMKGVVEETPPPTTPITESPTTLTPTTLSPSTPPPTTPPSPPTVGFSACYVCGASHLQVTLTTVIPDSVRFPRLDCAFLQLAGLEGYVAPLLCPEVTQLVTSQCACQPGTPLPTIPPARPPTLPPLIPTFPPLVGDEVALATIELTSATLFLNPQRILLLTETYLNTYFSAQQGQAFLQVVLMVEQRRRLENASVAPQSILRLAGRAVYQFGSAPSQGNVNRLLSRALVQPDQTVYRSFVNTNQDETLVDSITLDGSKLPCGDAVQSQLETSLVVDFVGDPNQATLSQLRALEQNFLNTYNTLQKTQQYCDFWSRRIANVTIDLQTSVQRRQLQAGGVFGTLFGMRFTLFYRVRYSCYGCPKGTNLYGNDAASRRRLLRSRHPVMAQARDVVNDCSCPANATIYDSPTELDFTLAYNKTMDTINFVDGIVDSVTELEPITCSSNTITRTTTVVFNVTGDPDSLTGAEVVTLQQAFEQSYSDLAEQACDPFFRTIQTVTLERVEQRRSLRAQPNFNQFFRLYLSIRFQCRQCPQGSSLFVNDGGRRRLKDASSTRQRSLQQFDTCYCNTNSETNDPPTLQDFIVLYNETIQALGVKSVVSIDSGTEDSSVVCPAGESFQSCCGAFSACQGACPGPVNSAACCAYNGGTVENGVCCAAVQSAISLCFVLDESGSIDSIEFDQIQNFTVNLIGGVASNPSVTTSEYAIVTYSDTGILQFSLGTAVEAQAFVTSYLESGGGTATYLGMDLCTEELSTNSLFAKAMIVITDGDSNDQQAVIAARDAAAAAGITVVAVGVGSGISITNLQETATDNQLVYQVGGFSSLDSIVNDLVAAAQTQCTVVS